MTVTFVLFQDSREREKTMNEKEANCNQVPPNGGWGWLIVVAYALNGISTIPLIQGFGLIFKDTFPRFGFNATQSTIIINVNLSFGMVLGLMNGPLLKRFGYRNVATFGTCIYAIGVTSTAFANTFLLITLSYGILASLGMGLTMSAYSLAVNSYFTTNRGRAMALALTIIGLGPILMPHVTSILISYYGPKGTILLYGAFSLHSLIGAALLQPIKWHMKDGARTEMDPIGRSRQTEQNEAERIEESELDARHSGKGSSRAQRARKLTVSSINHDADIASIYGFETPLPRQLSESLATPSLDTLSKHFCLDLVDDDLKSKGNYLYKSIDTIHLGSSFRIFEEPHPETMTRYYSVNDLKWQPFQEQETRALLNEKGCDATAVAGVNFDEERKKERVRIREALKTIVRFLDLDLLRDPVYVNILVGMGIAIFAEVNFSVLMPFILADVGMSTEQIANMMSLMAGADLLSRIIAPFLGEWLGQPARIMYLISLTLLVLSRTSLLFANGLTAMLIVAIGLGAAKGIRSVYMSLVLPSCVPIHRLPYASGLQMVLNGIVLISAGPIIGIIRDKTGSYTPCIILINCVTLVTVVLWLTELLLVRRVK